MRSDAVQGQTMCAPERPARLKSLVCSVASNTLHWIKILFVYEVSRAVWYFKNRKVVHKTTFRFKVPAQFDITCYQTQKSEAELRKGLKRGTCFGQSKALGLSVLQNPQRGPQQWFEGMTQEFVCHYQLEEEIGDGALPNGSHTVARGLPQAFLEKRGTFLLHGWNVHHAHTFLIHSDANGFYFFNSQSHALYRYVMHEEFVSAFASHIQARSSLLSAGSQMSFTDLSI